MMPSFVASAQDEWILPPTKYRLSNTFAGSAYQVSRAGALAGSVMYGGTTSLASSPPLCGSRQTRTSVPRNSNPAAVLADCTAAWASASKSRLPCAKVPEAASAAMKVKAILTCFMESPGFVGTGVCHAGRNYGMRGERVTYNRVFRSRAWIDGTDGRA